MNNANPNSLSRLYLEARAAGCPKDQLARFHDLAYIPFPKQLRFHAAARACDRPNGPTQLGFGGARGPGKSHASFMRLFETRAFRSARLYPWLHRRNDRCPESVNRPARHPSSNRPSPPASQRT